MKLAVALLLRVEYRERRDALTKRVHSNLKVQEGDAPHEDPAALLREALELEERMGALVKAIDRTNARARLADGRPLTEALADRETLRQKRLLLSQTLEEAQKRDYRLTHSEVRMQVTVEVKSLQRELDQLCRQYRELDARIQAVNWTEELAD